VVLYYLEIFFSSDIVKTRSSKMGGFMTEHRKYRRERMKLISSLYGFGLTASEIADVIGNARDTVCNDLCELGGDKAFPKRLKGKTKIYQTLFIEYLKYRDENIKPFWYQYVYTWLKIDELIGFARGVEFAFETLHHPYAPKKYERAATLVGDIFGMRFNRTSNPSAENNSSLWDDYCNRVKTTSIKTPTSPSNAQDTLLHIEEQMSRKSIAPIWTEATINLILHARSILDPREQEIINSYYGLKDQRSQKLDEISRKLGISRERVRQLKNRTILTMRNHLDRFNFVGKLIGNSVEERVKETIENIAREEFEEKETATRSLGIFARSISILELSARPRNSLEAASISTIGVLVHLKEKYIKDLPGIGKKSFAEIVDKLADYNLKLGMKMV
jgi:RNA polymerase sigma factor (sigma-70 family)